MKYWILVGGAVAGVLVAAGSALANNLVVTNLTVSVRDNSTAYIKFDIAWEKSWRTKTNHDAAWVFFKVRPDTRPAWEHVTLEGTGRNPKDYSIGTGTGIELIVPTDRVGLFVRRSAEGAGTTSVQNVTAVWNLAANSLAKTDKVRVQALAVEMVYVAQGNFSVGSGGTGRSEFYKYPNTNTPYAITNEDAITVGTVPGNLYYEFSSQGGDQRSPIPAAFPKGQQAFYCMKYETTEGQWVDFFNTLTDAQKTTRDITGPTGKNSDEVRFRNTVAWTAGDATTAARSRACSYLSWADGTAFADWAGLRPMTELEYEKACRGSLPPVPNEYAWGDVTIRKTLAVVTNDQGEDTALSGNCNCEPCLPDGPFSVGIYTAANSTRHAAGASYWGIMDLTGNLCEQIVTVGAPPGRAFTGLPGDGKLDTDGNANVTDWPNAGAYGAGVCGGSWFYPSEYATVANRIFNALTHANRDFATGWRAVRTAPAELKPSADDAGQR